MFVVFLQLFWQAEREKGVGGEGTKNDQGTQSGGGA